jgi:hypothetical protein
MIDRSTGRGVVGSIWDDQKAMEASAAGMPERRSLAASRGVKFDEISFRELLLAEMR